MQTKDARMLARWLTPRFVSTTFFILLGIVFIISAIQHDAKCRDLSRIGTQTRTAFLRWRTQLIGEETPGRGAMPGFSKGDDVYRQYNYPNPPIMALLLLPLAELPPRFGAFLFFVLKLLMTFAIFRWAFKLCEPIPQPHWRWVMMGTIVISMHPILGDLSHGNVNIFIAFLVMGCLELYRRGWAEVAGIVLALAIACKVTPALFLPYFGWKFTVGIYDAFRERISWRTAMISHSLRLLLGCVVGLALWFVVVPGAIIGHDHNVKLLESWYDVMVKPFIIDGKITSEHSNQSIPGVVARLLTNAHSDFDYNEDDQGYGTKFHNLTDIGIENAKRIVQVCQAVWVLGVLAFAWSRSRHGLRFAAETSFVMMGMLLFSERTWKHHAVVLVLPFAVLLTYWAGRPQNRFIPILLGMVLLLMLVPSALGGDMQDLALTYGTHLAAFLLITLGVVVVMSTTTDQQR